MICHVISKVINSKNVKNREKIHARDYTCMGAKILTTGLLSIVNEIKMSSADNDITSLNFRYHNEENKNVILLTHKS